MRQSSSGNFKKSLVEYKWSLLALGIMLGVLLSSRGGFSMLARLGRWLLPLALIYMGFRWAKKKFLAAAQEALRKQMGAQGMGWPPQRPGSSAGGQDRGRTIDLCPQCGSYLAPGHRCKS